MAGLRTDISDIVAENVTVPYYEYHVISLHVGALVTLAAADHDWNLPAPVLIHRLVHHRSFADG